jgi:hypothetical protein
MRRAAAFLLLACLPAAAQLTKTAVPGGAPATIGPIKAWKVAPGTFLPLEGRFNQQLSTLFDVNDPLDLLGYVRGVYLEGYGVVFTADISLVVTPRKSPFQQTIPPALAAKVRQRKIERLPVLKTAMKEMMRTAASTFLQIPTDQQIVISVRFLYEPWEDRTGMPSQILMRADRKSAIEGNVQMEEQ